MNEDTELAEYESFSKRMEETFPKMFENKYGGFAVGKGWYPILEALCANIQSHIDWRNRETETVPQVVVEQIKEKFGGLRFYYQGGDEQVHGMVRMAEAWAENCCEECCAPGIRRNGGWIRTLCDQHEAEHQKRSAEREEEYAKHNGLEL
jgi:hypothetical protein